MKKLLPILLAMLLFGAAFTEADAAAFPAAPGWNSNTVTTPKPTSGPMESGTVCESIFVDVEDGSKTPCILGEAYDPSTLVISGNMVRRDGSHYVHRGLDLSSLKVTPATFIKTGSQNVQLSLELTGKSGKKETFTTTSTVYVYRYKEYCASVYVARNPLKTIYRVGDSFDKTGMKFGGNMETRNGETYQKDLTAGYRFATPTKFQQTGEQEVTFTFTLIGKSDYNESFKTSIIVNVLPAAGEALAEKWCESVYIARDPDKMTYAIGETFDPTGMILNAVMKTKDGKSETVQLPLNDVYEYAYSFGTETDKAVVTLYVREKGKSGIAEKFTVYLRGVTVNGEPAKTQKDTHTNRARLVAPPLKPIYSGGTQNWTGSSGARRFRMADGTYLTGWQAIDGRRYYFNESGILQTGWFKDTTGEWFCAYSDGTMYDGQLENYVCDNGRWVRNEAYVVNPTWAEIVYFVIDGNGHVVTKDGWYTAATGDRFYVQNGEAYTGWVDGYYAWRGKLAKNTCVPTQNGAYYGTYDGWTVFDDSGKAVKTAGWFCDGNGQWYYIDSNGYGATGYVGDQYIDHGFLATGAVKMGNNTLALFDESGRQIKKGGWFADREGNYCYFNWDGTPYTGWVDGRYCEAGYMMHNTLGNMIPPNYEDMYYFNKDGLVPGGWTLDIWGDWHYYTNDGKIFTGTVDGLSVVNSWLNQ